MGVSRILQPPSMSLALGLAVCLVVELGHVGGSSLRRISHVGVASSNKTSGFDSLAECEVAYDNMRQRYVHDKSTVDCGDELAGGAYRKGDLMDDADGSHAKRFVEEHYKPPEGWDYSLHGDDWTGLGDCGSENQQSPIDLDKYIDVRGQTKYLLWFDYYLDPDLKESTVAHLVNDGHSLRYNVQSNNVDLGLVKIGTEEFFASDYIFHAPSEHTVDGAVFPLELQIYNRAREGKGMVAIAIFFREGASNPFLKGIADSMGDVPSWTSKTGSKAGTLKGSFPDAFDLETVLPKGSVSHEKVFYNYQGSLTQPPCTTGVDWWVLAMPITASREEIRFIRKAIFKSDSMPHGNARATVPLGNRSLFVGLTGFQSVVKGHAMQVFSGVKPPEGEYRGYNSHDTPWGDHWKLESFGPGPAPGPVPGSPVGGDPISPAPAD